MNSLYRLSLVTLLVSLVACSELPGPQTDPPSSDPILAELPFSVSLRQIPADGWRGGHSFAVAEVGDNQVVIVGGRSNGLHEFPNTQSDGEAFPRASANNMITLLDVADGTVLGEKSVDDLPHPVNLHLKNTNAQYATQDGWLFYIGGYGEDPANPTLITQPFVTAIQLDALVTALQDPGATLDPTFFDDNMAFDDFFDAAKVTGGALLPVYEGATGHRLDDHFYLVFGHEFNGLYYGNGAAAYQQYKNRVQHITLAVRPTGAGSGPQWQIEAQYLGSFPEKVQEAENLPPDNPYHRRDLPVVASFDPITDEMAITAYGGVFKNDLGGYLEPVYILSDASGNMTVRVDEQARQYLSQYKGPVIQMVDQNEPTTLYSTFFGGISYYYWDSTRQELVHDPVQLPHDGLPFIESVSALVATSSGTTNFLNNELTFPPAGDVFQCHGEEVRYLGAETHLVPIDHGIQRLPNGVIDYTTLSGSQVIGYLIGGIAATAPSASVDGKSCASNRIYEVTVTVGTPQSVTLLTVPD